MNKLMSLPERRASVRFPTLHELRYKVLERGSIVCSGSGVTHDISSGGVAFTADHPLWAGALVELSINWPAKLDNGCPLCLFVIGKVVRSHQRQSVCTIEKHEFRTKSRAVPLIAASPNDTLLRSWTKLRANSRSRRVPDRAHT